VPLGVLECGFLWGGFLEFRGVPEKCGGYGDVGIIRSPAEKTSWKPNWHDTFYSGNIFENSLADSGVLLVCYCYMSAFAAILARVKIAGDGISLKDDCQYLISFPTLKEQRVVPS